jgi:hypothetical protein
MPGLHELIDDQTDAQLTGDLSPDQRKRLIIKRDILKCLGDKVDEMAVAIFCAVLVELIAGFAKSIGMPLSILLPMISKRYEES